ncbi:tautomerase family protein [Paludibacterium yongneupense]|uniref:tautomerase family protein n=1 Tax=Paludibacterium yongneupense TaxID=400061 RepID=UPI00041C9757|nr:tautomerase family protein [Paludibacterium yongneupense]
MPYVRISLLEGKSADYLGSLSDTLHQAMVETFNVPAKDRFHIFHQLASEAFVFDREYMCGPRSDDFVLIAITTGRTRDAATRQAFFRRLADLLEIAPGIRRQDVMVVITNSEMGEWSFGDGVSALPVAV